MRYNLTTVRYFLIPVFFSLEKKIELEDSMAIN